MPTDAPPVHTGVQGREGNGVGMGMGLKVSMGGSGSSKGDDDAKVVGKVISTQLHTSLPKTSFTTTSTTTPKGPLTKGVVIDSGVGGSSSSKPPPSTEELKNKGKCISVEPTKEEKKAAVEEETERQRQIQSILRQRANDLPGLDKGDPSKHYCY